jgi:poly(A) polymerase
LNNDKRLNCSRLAVEPEALSLLVRMNQALNQQQILAYMVGGYVRDALLGRPTADFDIAVSGDAMSIARDIAEILGGTFVPLDEVNRIARVVLNIDSASHSGGYWNIDFSTLDGNILQDLGRRDFTINAMAVELNSLVQDASSCKILDPFAGQESLSQRVIQALSETVFEADPARLLRAVRLAAELDFTLSPETETLVHRDSRLISQVAGERVREELMRILAVDKAGRFVRRLDDLGLLTAIIPELEPSRGVDQPKEHYWKVLDHSIETVRAADFLIRRDSWEYTTSGVLEDVPWSEKIDRHFRSDVGKGTSRAALLRLAALLHDISKPETKILDKEKVRFFGHTEQGAEVAVRILGRLRFSKIEIRLVELMVRYHLRPTQMSQAGMPTRRAIYRYSRDTGSAAIDILFLSLADHLAARGPGLQDEDWQWHTDQVNYILTESYRQEKIIPPRLIDGHDLINLFGLKPGPRIRAILESVKEAQAAGELTTRTEALSYVQNRLL